MIPAIEALALPGAQLTTEELEAADKLELAIDTHVKKFMAINGVDFETQEKSPRVVAEVNQRLKRAGWNTQWQLLVEPSRFNKAAQVHTGFKLALAPSDAAFLEHAGRATIGPRSEPLCANPAHEECCSEKLNDVA